MTTLFSVIPGLSSGALLTVYDAATAAVVVTMGLALFRATQGPTVYDRILALNAFGTKTVLLIALIGFVVGRPEWLDLAITYVLINFVGTLAVMRFSKYGSLAREGDEDEPEEDEAVAERSASMRTDVESRVGEGGNLR